jgi:CRISPR-associated endonuclease/helicase Cas3
MLQEPKQLLHSALELEPGQSAFPWQEALLEKMCHGELPDALDIPTGLGKTSVMAIWLVARACGASLPRRLVYVVDRRAVVDQATEVAMGLRNWVERNPPCKKLLGLKDRPLPISTLRGQFVDNREWLEDPSQPAIIVGTVDMVGSRLLFEGYGVSRKMRPYHAGLLGVDTLLVLDEAHLTPPFEHLLRAIASDPVFRPRDAKCDAIVPRFKLLSLTATGRPNRSNALGLTQDDFKHEVLSKRLHAQKALRLQPLVGDSKLQDELAIHAWTLAGDGRKAIRVIVYSNSREVAQKAREALEKLAKRGNASIDTELFVGSRRVFEREQVKRRLEDLGFLAGTKVERTCPAFLFATSAGEVGVDLDAEHMVCDLVAWERMVQRLGRVNRRGEPESHVAEVIVLVTPEPRPDKKTEEALRKRDRNEKLSEKETERIERYERQVQEWKNWQMPLKKLPQKDGSFDASISALIQLSQRSGRDPELQEILARATSEEPLRPAITLPLIEAWSLTSLKKHPGRPAIQPWLRGWVKDEPQTAIVWRTYLPVRKGGKAPRRTEIEDFFEAAPPHTSERLETETFRAVDWILARVKMRKVNARSESKSDEPLLQLRDAETVAFVVETDGTLRKSFTLGDLKSLHEKKDEFRNTLNNATLVVDARLGGLNNGVLDAAAGDPPPTADGSDWLGRGAVGFRVRTISSSEATPREANWRERFRFACEVSEDGEPIRWIAVDKWQNDAATEDDRSEGQPQLLREHEERAQQRARDLARALRLNSEHEEILALAAHLHDEGKRSARWQRAFNAPEGDLYAKTEGPINQGLLDGYRHELGSLLRVENDHRVCNLSEDQRDLLLHLIGAHHGFARPVIATDACDDAPPSVLEEKAADIALRFARLQNRWGPWGLAWWEALLRAADQLASRNDGAGSSRVGGS